MVVTSAYARPYTLWGVERRELGVSPSGEEYVIFSRREICATRVFLGGKSRKKWRGHCRCVEKLVYFRNLFSSISWRKDFVTLVLSF